MLEYILFVGAALSAGLTWTGFGYLNAWRKHRNEPDWTGFNKKKLRNDAVLGVLLGIGVIIYQAYQGNPVPAITDFISFVAVAGGLSGTVAVVDKFFVGGILGID